MSLVNSLAKVFCNQRLKRIETSCSTAARLQWELFQELLDKGKKTTYGKDHQFSSISNYTDWCKQVPVVNYEELYPYIERVLKGENYVLYPEKVHQFSMSSGTTNDRSKYIPVTKESLEECHYKGGKDMLALYVDRFPETTIFDGKNIAVGGSLRTSPMNPEKEVGDISALIMKNLPFWAELKRSPDLETALMSDYEQKIEKIAQSTLNEEITGISGVPTWTMLLLQRVCELKGVTTVKEVWPEFEVFFHGAVNFEPYRSTFKSLIGGDGGNYLELYNASEGFFAIQGTHNENEMLLMMDYGIFYEFIPPGEWHKPFPKTVPLEEVDTQTNYALVISTNGGLWRYRIGDTIRFTSTDPYRIKISGRTKHFINAFGEEVMVENSDEAIAFACKETNVALSDYTVAPIYLDQTSKGGHEWIIEFKGEKPELSSFTKALDSRLRELNSDYDAKRVADLALIAPTIHMVEKGTFYTWMKSRGKLGGQHKVPRLANDRKYVDGLLNLLKQEA